MIITYYKTYKNNNTNNYFNKNNYTTYNNENNNDNKFLPCRNENIWRLMDNIILIKS